MTRSTRRPDPTVTVDVALLTVRHGRLCVLLSERSADPFAGTWALPGGTLGADEDADDAARSALSDATGIGVEPWHVEQLRTYTDPGRDPSGRSVSIAYVAFVPNVPAPRTTADAAGARFWPVEDVLDGGDDAPALAFDHEQILADAVERARAKLEYTTLATAFADEPFTIGDLRRVYEAVWGATLHPGNFTRKVLSTPDFVAPTGGHASRGPGRPALLYRAGDATALNPPITRPSPGDDGIPTS